MLLLELLVLLIFIFCYLFVEFAAAVSIVSYDAILLSLMLQYIFRAFLLAVNMISWGIFRFHIIQRNIIYYSGCLWFINHNIFNSYHYNAYVHVNIASLLPFPFSKSLLLYCRHSDGNLWIWAV